MGMTSLEKVSLSLNAGNIGKILTALVSMIVLVWQMRGAVEDIKREIRTVDTHTTKMIDSMGAYNTSKFQEIGGDVKNLKYDNTSLMRKVFGIERGEQVMASRNNN